MAPSIKHQAVELVNRPLNTLGFRLVRTRSAELWDREFASWIAAAEHREGDPNDVGDEEWATDELTAALEQWYLPAVGESAVVVELGPGTGRLTRHLARRAKRVIAVDRSDLVVKWIKSYLPAVEMHQVSTYSLPIPDGTADVFVAHGVFEHLGADESFWFLADAARILRPGGVAIFNFDNAVSPGGIEHLRKTSSRSKRSDFRFHHPEAIRALSLAAGFGQANIHTSETRIGFAHLTR